MRAALRIAAAALVLAVAGGATAPVVGLGPTPEVRAAATDLTLVANAAYTVDPAARRVHVSAAITVVNHTRETKIRRYYFDHAFLAVQPGTSGYRLAGAPGARVRVARRTTDATLLRIDFGKRLYSGGSRAYRLTFDLLGAGRGANPQTRVGTGLVTVPLWAYASPGAGGASVSVAFPKGWDVSVASGRMPVHVTGADGGTILRSGPIAAPLAWFAYVTGQQPAVYTDHRVSIGAGTSAIPLVMRAWADDPGWADRTAGLFREALPPLAEAIGLPWPHRDPMVVQEAVSRSDGAYAGLYDPVESRIEVAYWADGRTTLHEAAHGWFNGSLLADRWANEGFASLYADRVATALELKGKGPVMTDKAKAAAVPLNAWPIPDAGALADPGTAALEAYGYAASYELATAIADRAGDAALQRVWADAANGVGAYQPPANGAASGPAAQAAVPEGVSGPPDWRGLLDLLDAETGKDFTDLWRAQVVRPEEAGMLDARAAARTSYARTLALAGDWQLPRTIRDALRAWQFDAAEQQLADARTVLAQHAALAEMAGEAGVTLPDTMRQPFEEGRMADASAIADAQRTALTAIGKAAASRSSEDDILSRLGQLGAHPEQDLEQARAAFASADVETTMSAADNAYQAWAGAWQEGRRRAMLALAGLATLIVVVSALGGALRRSRGSARPPASRTTSSTG